MRKTVLLSLFGIILLSGLAIANVSAYYSYAAASSPHITIPKVASCSGGLCSNETETATLSVVYYAPHDLIANRTLLDSVKGLTPDCWALCYNGVHYFEDPTILITNEGHDYIQYMLSGVAHSVTPGSTDRATIEGVSTSATAPLVTDTFAAAGPCDTSNIASTMGFTAVAGTVTAGTPSAGSVTWTIVNTFTASGTLASVQVGCLLTEVTAGSHPYIFGEGTFGPFSFVSGNTLAETWQITAT